MNALAPTVDSTLPPHLRGHYQLQDSEMTLAEGLEEYWRVNPGLDDPREMSDRQAAHYFTCHDACHVVFGTHTGDLDEACNDYYTLFAVDLHWKEYVGGFLKTEQSKSILDYYLKAATLKMLWHSVVLLPAVWRIARQVHKKWPWQPTQDMMQTPLRALRQEYGIQVIHPERMLAERRWFKRSFSNA